MGIKVKAVRLGFMFKRRIYPGEEFELAAKEEFSDSSRTMQRGADKKRAPYGWMAPADEEAAKALGVSMEKFKKAVQTPAPPSPQEAKAAAKRKSREVI